MKWDGDSCVEVAICSPAGCRNQDLTEHHLLISGRARNSYIHGDQIKVRCVNGYEFENGKKRFKLRCRNGRWLPLRGEHIPNCLKYFDCLTESMANIRLSGDDARQNPNGTTTIEHDSSARYVIITKICLSFDNKMSDFKWSSM